MKKFITVLLSLTIFLSAFTACAKKEQEQKHSESESNTEDSFVDTECTDEEKNDIEKAETENSDTEKAVEDNANTEEALLQSFLQQLRENVNLATIHVSTKDNAQIVSREEYVDCEIELLNCEEQYIISSADAGIRVRGNSSAYYGDPESILKNQVPYKIKFDKKQNLLGLNDGLKFKSWVLLKANTNLLADYMAFKLGKIVLSSNVYCSDCAFVQVYVNTEYKGLYLLAEQNQVNQNRVDITEAPQDYVETDIGYLVEIDHYASDKDNYFLVDYSNESFTDVLGKTLSFSTKKYTVKSDVYSQEQVDFIAKYINNCFKIVLEASKGNYLAFDESYELVPSPHNNAFDTVNEVIDIHSVVNMYILDEIICDRDCGMGSFYMCVDFSQNSKVKKLTFTSPWDSGWAYIESYTELYAGAFQSDEFIERYTDRSNPWYLVLAKEDWFVELVKERWKEVYTDDGFKKTVNDAYGYVEANVSELNRQYPNATDEGIILLEWLDARMKWLDGIWGIGTNAI